MANPNSPLNKYKREPKLYIDLPSKGEYYPPGSLESATELPVYSMTARDEIAVKTPDALFSGHSTVSIIQRCIPGIKNAWAMPMIDVEYCLAAIRLASYGADLNLEGECPECKESNSYTVNLQTIIDYFLTLEYSRKVTVEDLEFYIRPLTYKENSALQKQMFNYQRQIVQHVQNIEDENTQAEELQKIYDSLANVRVNAVVMAIEKVIIDGEEETDKDTIANFVDQNDKKFFQAVAELVGNNNEIWDIPNADVVCPSCNHNYSTNTNLDYSNFFALGL